MRVRCYDCGHEAELDLGTWRCTCGGAWEPIGLPAFDPGHIHLTDFTIWRYGQMLGLDVVAPHQQMGVGWTPVVPVTLAGQPVVLKLEYLMPTGSFKDRGINAMVNQLVSMGVQGMVEDSSGNAGASLAAHGARFGIPTQIFVPEYASAFKQHQIALYGIEMHKIEGSRKDTEAAAQSAVTETNAYASHAYHPAYLAGQITVAYEVWEQLGRKVPDWIVCPVAQGGQFLGFWIGFSRLKQAGLIDRMPRLVAVQSARVAPLYHAWREGLADVPPVDPSGPTLAEGVSISNPVRGKRLLEAVRNSQGLVVAIEEDEIQPAQQLIAHMGYYIEPTSALIIAAMPHLADRIRDDALVLLPLTGSGLKGAPKTSGV
jgi:threonine synthase